MQTWKFRAKTNTPVIGKF